MNVHVTKASDGRTRGLTVGTVLAAWRGITLQQALITFLLGCGMFLYRAAVTINIDVAPYIFVGDQMKAFALLLTLVIADRITGKDPDRRGAYVLAVVVGATIVVPLTVVVVAGLMHFVSGLPINPPGRFGFLLNIYFELLMVGGATVWIINDRRRARRARSRRHSAELERIAAEKRSIESDLQAMQARIEPQFLFDTLAQVQLLYGRDHATGEQLLDALIAYLRAAVPRMRETSTVRHELALVRAYLSIARLRMGGRIAFSIDPVEAAVADAAMPAMVLLPLVDHAIARVPSTRHADTVVRVRAVANDGGVRLEVSGAGLDLAEGFEGGSIAGGSIAGVRDRLASLYGRKAALALEGREAGGSVAVLQLPHD